VAVAQEAERLSDNWKVANSIPGSASQSVELPLSKTLETLTAPDCWLLLCMVHTGVGV